MVAWFKPDAGAPGTTRESAAADHAIIGGSAWEGLRAAFRSPYLLGISGYVLMMTVTATFIYFTRLQMVAAQTDDTDTRTALFANIDMITQVVTLLLQLVVTGQLMKRLGVSVSLALLPAAVSLGFIGLALVASFAALVLFDATFRAIQRAIARPARETLFTVVSRDDKYKSKAFTDTFVYRGGDVLGAWTEGLLGRLGTALVGLASVAVPIAVAWGLLGLWLGRRQGALAAEFGSHPAEASASERAGAALGGQPRPAIR
jgi:AAA family ATP:ADP antiporter